MMAVGSWNNEFEPFVLRLDLAESFLYEMNSLRAISRSLAVTVVLLLAMTAAYSQNNGQFSINESPLPAPTGYVNDYAGVLDAATKQQVEDKIKQFKDTSNPSTELAVAIVRTTGDRDIFDYSLAVARGWKIGSDHATNPGALLFVAIDDRKYFTQVSRDLEGDLPDAAAGSLQRQYLVPQFRQSNYGKGISDTIDAYIRTILAARGGAVSATPTPAGITRTNGSSGGISSLCCFLIIGLIILMIILRSSGGGGGGRRSGWGGGGFGGAAGALPWIIGSILSSGGGRSSDSSWGGGGSSWGGGGGFGGFGGGGDFGGGGAGGSW
jgi:uncharacterized protein